MSNTIYKLERTSQEPLGELVRQIKDSLTKAQGLSIEAELVFGDVEPLGDAETALLVFEKLYFRNGSYCNLTIRLTSYDYRQKAVIIGSGGGEGLLNISLGANANFAKRALDILTGLGFK